MQEQEIVDQLKQNLPEPYKTDLPAVEPADTTQGQATIAPAYELDELTQYKLHDYFGETYKPSNEESKQRVAYIYEHVADMLEDKNYGFVVAKIREIERVIGITNDERRVYKLYQWLKLEGLRRNIDVEMGALSNG